MITPGTPMIAFRTRVGDTLISTIDTVQMGLRKGIRRFAANDYRKRWETAVRLRPGSAWVKIGRRATIDEAEQLHKNTVADMERNEDRKRLRQEEERRVS